MLTEENVVEALRSCFEPELKLNLVDLGLVHAIDLAPDHEAPGAGIPGVPPRQRLRLTLLAASEDETSRAQLRAVVTNRLAGMPELSRAEVVIVDSPQWSPTQSTPEARQHLQRDGVRLNQRTKPLFAILNNRLR